MNHNILKVIKGKVFLGEEEITPSEVKILSDEIKSFKRFRLRSLFYESLRQYAVEEGFESSVAWDTTLHFKGMVDGIDRMKAIEKTIESQISKVDKSPGTGKILKI